MTSTDPKKNWAGNYAYKARGSHEPKDVTDIQEFVRRSEKIKAVGSRHCFNDIADTNGIQISTRLLEPVIEIDETAMTVTISSGLTYGDICPELHARGFALHNLASLPHISVVGACATATHGSGIKNGNLATAVSRIEFVSGTGELVTLDRTEQNDFFFGAVVNLGGFGVITKLTLDIEPAFSVKQDVFQDLPFTRVSEHFDEIMSSGYSVSLFTNWRNKLIDQVWVKRKLADDLPKSSTSVFGSRPATGDLHPIAGISAENCTEQMGNAGAWFERLPHFKMGFTPSSGEELQTEYFVPLENAADAILAIETKREALSPRLLVSEIRTIAGDQHWLSPCYRRDSAAIHFTWKPNVNEVTKLLPMLEAELAPFGARPHWGKLFATPPKELRHMYPMLPEFVDLLARYDPRGKFRNGFLDRLILDR
ncbi:MAG TPA: D-arabinono-1,4-lactone oxidase [Pyrinomonadaceae bacterium]|nr:D-arabinono-1,4-lactone oxidase [Pyrinomonadaceae bacterium]